MSASKEQLTQRANTALKAMEELRKKLPETGTWEDQADRTAWEASNKDYDEATKALDALTEGEAVRQRMAEIEERRKKQLADSRSSGDLNDPDHGSSREVRYDQKDLFRIWAKRQMGANLSKRDREICKRAKNFNPRAKDFSFNLSPTVDFQEEQYERSLVHHTMWNRRGRDQRALTVSATSGGEMIGRMKMPGFEKAMLDFSGVLQACDIMTTATGEPLDWPTANDSGNEGALLAINTQAASNVDPATSEVTFEAYKFTSKIVLVPVELLEDDTSGFASQLDSMLGERVGRALETYFTTGSGSSQPNGIVTASGAGVTAASTTAVTADEVIGLEHTVDPAYRNDRCGFMMHDAVIKALRLLKDGESRYLWASGLRDARPDTLLGYRVFRNQKMASTLEASAKIMLFGDFSKYKARIVRGVRFRRLVERYADYDQEGFVAFIRADGDLLNAGTNPIKRITLAAS